MTTCTPTWALPILQRAAQHLPLPLDVPAAAYTLLDEGGVEWHLEATADHLLLHCQLADDGLRCNEDRLRGLLAHHHEPQAMDGACIALDTASGVLRLVQAHARDSPTLDDLPGALQRLQCVRRHLLPSP
ncbi:hypothetical protein ABE522_05330 [Stenotrophomonas pennii]|uniref:hypothetical protein n=1 Tax=Stenotrophomonas lacuserhaii TaxID=2760084 RepID=UPI003209C38D